MKIRSLTIASLWLAVAFSIASWGAIAQQPAAKHPASKPAKSRSALVPRWENEPDSFMGMRFGEPLPECPTVAPDNSGLLHYDYPRISTEGKICFTHDEYYRELTRVENLPDIGTYLTINSPHLLGGVFEGLFFQFDNRDYGKLEQLLISRFGAPSSKVPTTFKNRVGLTLESADLVWRGRNVTLFLSRYGSEIDKGKVDIFTHAWSAHLQQKRQEEVNKVKGNL